MFDPIQKSQLVALKENIHSIDSGVLAVEDPDVCDLLMEVCSALKSIQIILEQEATRIEGNAL